MSLLVHDSIEFHNAAALESRAGMPGPCPVRVPEEVRAFLNPGARRMAAEATGVELRFVTEAPAVRVGLAAQEKDLTVHVYRGGFWHSDHVVPAGGRRILDLAAPAWFQDRDVSGVDTGPFSPELWRLQLSGGCAGYLGLDANGFEVRPPRSEEKPQRRWLAYGSSITHSRAKGYPHQAARRLGVDVLNKGVAGSCHGEGELADYFVMGEDWDCATVELGVNMRGLFEVEAFCERATRFVERLREGRPEALIVLITHFLNRDHWPTPEGAYTEMGRRQEGYDEVLRGLAAREDLRLHLVEGRELLSDAEGLSCDLLHPSDYGQVWMGERLADRLRRCRPFS